MDLGSECSFHESVEDNEVVVTQGAGAASHVDNGSCSNETSNSPREFLDANEVHVDDNHEKGVDRLNSPPLATNSPTAVSPPVQKGFGLKKWRRIKRDVVKVSGITLDDDSKVLKRGLSLPVSPTRPQHPSLAETRQHSEGYVGSANTIKNGGGVVDGFAMCGSSLDSTYPVVPTFAAGADSENSEDRSTVSSTAASAPKWRHEFPAVSGHGRERNRTKNMSGKSGGNSSPRSQKGKSQAETSKKHRGEKVKIEKENSHSSMESDSRSSNLVFMQGDFSVTSNGRQSGRSMNYEGENSDDVHMCKRQFSEEVRIAYAKQNVREAQDLSQDDLAADLSWNVKEEQSENHHSSTDRDHLAESILNLQSVQEALEKEVQKFGEIGKDGLPPNDNSFNRRCVPPAADSTFKDAEIHGPSSLEMQVLSLTENLKYLESKLEAKESRVAELEATLNSSKPVMGSTTKLQLDKCKEMESKVEGLYQQKIEAEIVCIVLTRATQKLGVAAGDRISLFEEQETLVEEQAQMQNKLMEAESKATKLKKRAEELEEYCEDAEMEKRKKKKLRKLRRCCIMQLILLYLAIRMYMLPFLPHPGAVLPT